MNMSFLQRSNVNTSAYRRNEHVHKTESSLLGALTASFKKVFSVQPFCLPIYVISICTFTQQFPFPFDEERLRYSQPLVKINAR